MNKVVVHASHGIHATSRVAFERLTKVYVDQCLSADRGVEAISVAISADDPPLVTYFEVFRDQDAFDQHVASSVRKKHLRRLKGMSVEPSTFGVSELVVDGRRTDASA